MSSSSIHVSPIADAARRSQVAAFDLDQLSGPDPRRPVRRRVLGAHWSGWARYISLGGSTVRASPCAGEDLGGINCERGQKLQALRACNANAGGASPVTFGLDEREWNEELVLQRYELLYEAGLIPEAVRDGAKDTCHHSSQPVTRQSPPNSRDQNRATAQPRSNTVRQAIQIDASGMNLLQLQRDVQERFAEIFGPLAHQPGTKLWDYIFITLVIGGFIAILPVAGLDFRFGGANAPDWVVWLGYLVFIVRFHRANLAAGGEPSFRARRAHPGGSGPDGDRHRPYAIVRHPGYIGGSLLALSIALVLGSWWALIPVAVVVVGLVVRTIFEERTLRAELPRLHRIHAAREMALGARHLVTRGPPIGGGVG